MNILITGGNGFIGRNIIEFFASKYKLFSPSHTELDLLDTNSVDQFFGKNIIDVVIHCANVGGKRNDDKNINILNTNLRIFSNLLKNQTKFGKMIYFGSGAEYDKSRDIANIKESDFGNNIPVDDYGLYKYICSKLIENTNNIYCLRLFGVYGKYEDISVRLISNLISNYILKQPLTINQDCLFEYLYIDDFVKILEFFIHNSPKERFYNVGTGVQYRLLDLASIVNRLGDYSTPIIVKNPGMNKEYTSNCDKLKSIIPNLTYTPIETGINDLYQFYLRNL
ncbi:MAG: NAD-dependent epimerase/dehydratase family protein [bacterium]|nr:NAD-dependent epimerase/dehydratase family protein [bacterium]